MLPKKSDIISLINYIIQIFYLKIKEKNNRLIKTITRVIT